MAHVNPHTREVSANIVYCGPTGSGKTASLEFIHRKLRADLRGKITRVPAQLDPTASYELIPVELGEIKGMRTRFQIASVPGDPIHAPTRKALLRDVDGIVFVADARADHMTNNLESLKDLEENLAAYGRHLADVPLVFQWNRSEQPGALMPEALSRKLNPAGAEAFQSVATDGTGVLQALTTITKLILRNLRSATQAPAPAAPPRTMAEPAPATFRVAHPPPAIHLAESSGAEQFDPRSISQESDLAVGALQDSLYPLDIPSPAAPPPSRAIGIETKVEDSFADDLLEADAEPIGEEELPEASLADLSEDLLEEPVSPPRGDRAVEIREEDVESPILEGTSEAWAGTPTRSAPDLEMVTDLDAVTDIDAIPGLEGSADLVVEDLGPLDIPMEPFEDAAAERAATDALEAAFEPLDFAGEVTRLAGSDLEAELEPPAAPPAPARERSDDAWEIVGVGTPTRLGPATFVIPLEISEGGGEARVAEITITLSPPKPARKDP